MSIASEIARIRQNIASAYTSLAAKGAAIPSARNSANLSAAISGLVVPADPVTYNQMNAAAEAFLVNVSYDPTDYSYSELSHYVVATDYEKSKPAGATVTLPAGTLTLTDGENSMDTAVSSGSHTLYNITPGHTGAYLVKDSSKIVAAGLLKPTGALRMIKASATDNIRDLGGWTCDGGTVKYGKLFRGGVIYAADAALLHDLLGIRAELDLRWDHEVLRTDSVIGRDVAFMHISSPAYTLGSSGNWLPDAHKLILEYCMDQAINGTPLYFHCAAGADRTGTIAFLLESLLGLSQSDTDKDYELTSFYTGIGTDANARRRDEDDWKNFMAQFDSYSGSSMRDKVVSWAESIGISIDKINAFRSAMINGTPAVLPGSARSFSVTGTLSHVTASYTAQTADEFRPLKTELTPDDGYLIDQVQVLMGGVDITRSTFVGTEDYMRFSVTTALSHCSSDSTRKAVINGECFNCTLTPDLGYTFDGASVSITMGGVSMAQYFKNGVITIPRVTGNIVINVTAAASAPAYTNQITTSKSEIGGSAVYNSVGYKNNYRYNSSMNEAESSGTFTTGYIRIQPGDVVRLYGNLIAGNSSGYNSAFYKASDGTKQLQITPSDFYSGTFPGGITARMSNIVYDTQNHVLTAFTWSADYEVWAKFTFPGPFSAGNTVVTVNEEI